MASMIQGEATPGRSESAPRSGVLLTDALLVCMAVIWGVNYNVVKLATSLMHPLVFNALRIALAMLVLGGMAYALRAHRPSRAVAARLVLLGVLGHGIYQIAWVEGLSLSPVTTAALIFAGTPAFVGIVGRLLGVERLSRMGWAGIGLQLLGMSGVVLGSAVQAAGPNAREPLLGLGLILVASLSWAFYTTLLKKHAQDVHPIHLAAWTLVGGLAVYAVVATPRLLTLDYAALPPTAWAAVLYSGVGALVVAYLFYYRGMRVLGPVRTAMFSNLQPIIAMIVAYFVFREVPTVVQLGGAALIMTGLVVARA